MLHFSTFCSIHQQRKTLEGTEPKDSSHVGVFSCASVAWVQNRLPARALRFFEAELPTAQSLNPNASGVRVTRLNLLSHARRWRGGYTIVLLCNLASW